MAKLTMAQRKRMPSSSFALPGKGKGPHGKGAGSYPIGDKPHARNALSRVSQHGTPAEKATVRRKVHAKYPDIGKKQGGWGGSVGGAPRAPRVAMPKVPALVGLPKVRAPRPLTPRIGGRLSSAAGMKKGGMIPSPKKPHTYHGGGVATCGNMKNHGGFAELGIHKG